MKRFDVIYTTKARYIVQVEAETADEARKQVEAMDINHEDVSFIEDDFDDIESVTQAEE